MPNLSRLQRQAYNSFQHGEFDKAERLCAGILEYRPDDFDALHLLGMLHFQRHRMVEALRFLARALKEHRLGGAGIDVLPVEPPTEGEPLIDPSIPNLIVTPHIAWAAFEARQRCLDEMAANIRDFLDGGRRGRVV